MHNLVYFTADSSRNAQQNIDAFIAFSKQLTDLNELITFEDNYWKNEVNFVKVGVSSKDREVVPLV